MNIRNQILLVLVLSLIAGGMLIFYPSLSMAGIPAFFILLYLSLLPHLVMPLLLIVRSSIELIGDVPMGDLPVTNIATVVTVIMPILLVAVMMLKKFSFPRILLPFIFFFLAAFSGIVFSPDRVGFLVDYLRVFSLFAVLWATFIFMTEKSAKVFIASFCCGAIVPILFGTYQILFHKGLVQFGQFNRAYGSFRHPSDYGYFLLLLEVIIIGMWASYYKRKNAAVLFTLFAVILINMLFTFSRMVWILFIVALALFALLLSKKKKSNFIIFTILFLVIVSSLFFMDKITSRFEVEFNFSGRHAGGQALFGIPVTGSPSSRMEFMSAAMDAFLKNPLLGNGLGYFYYYLAPQLFKQNIEVHSDVVKLLCETGILGTIIFLYAFYVIFLYVWRHYKVAQDAFVRAVCLVGIVMLGTKVVQISLDAALRLVDVEFYWWAAMGIIMGFIKMDRIRTQ